MMGGSEGSLPHTVSLSFWQMGNPVGAQSGLSTVKMASRICKRWVQHELLKTLAAYWHSHAASTLVIRELP